MRSELTTNELFNLLNTRYQAYLDSGAKTRDDVPIDATAHNAVIATLRDVVENFSVGRLEVTSVKEVK